MSNTKPLFRYFEERTILSPLDLGSYSGDYEEHGVVECNAMKVGNDPTFRMNILPPFSGKKYKTNKKPFKQ
jgi:hypothetical protein